MFKDHIDRMSEKILEEEKVDVKQFFILLNALIEVGFNYTYKEIECGSGSHIACVESDNVVIWFGEEDWSISEQHQIHPRLMGCVCADTKPFDRMSTCPIQVRLPETTEQHRELVDLLEHINSREGRKWLSEYPEITYEYLEEIRT